MTGRAVATIFQSVIKRIELDFGGRSHLSAIQLELVRAFGGAAALLQAQNYRIFADQNVGEIDLTGYATLIGCMVRVASRLGLHRVAKEVPTLDQYLSDLNSRRANDEEASAVEDVADDGSCAD
jgi:hypothetical protein